MPTLTKSKRPAGSSGGEEDEEKRSTDDQKKSNHSTAKGVDEDGTSTAELESKSQSANPDDSESKAEENIGKAEGSEDEKGIAKKVESTTENNNDIDPAKDEDAGGATAKEPSAADDKPREHVADTKVDNAANCKGGDETPVEENDASDDDANEGDEKSTDKPPSMDDKKPAATKRSRSKDDEKDIVEDEGDMDIQDEETIELEGGKVQFEKLTEKQQISNIVEIVKNSVLQKKALEGVKESTAPSSSKKRPPIAPEEKEGGAASSSGSTPSKKKAKTDQSINEASMASSIVHILHQRLAEKDFQNHQGDFIRLSLKLPPSSERIGLVLQDDADNYGLSLVVGLTPDSPLSIPQSIIQRYWIIGIADSKEYARIISSEMLQKELAARRMKTKHVMMDFIFAKRREKPAGPLMVAASQRGGRVQPQQLQQQVMMQQVQAQVQMQAEMAFWQRAQRMATQAPQQVQMTEEQRLHKLQQQRMQEELADSAGKKRKGTKGKGTKGPTRKAPDDPSTRDEIIRQALIDFFTEGNSRSLETFCRARSRMFKAIDDEVISIPGLKEIVNRRATCGFSQKDCEDAWHLINIIFSGGQNKSNINKKKSLQLNDGERKWRPNFDSFKSPGQQCKGVQVKALEDWVANKNYDNAYLTETGGLAHFQGWRKKDCLFIAELDTMG